MQLVIFTGIQATGKSSFFKEYFYDTHVRINLDMLKTKHRENLLIEACLRAKQPFVIDKTNPTSDERSKYIILAKENRFSVTGYYFASQIDEAIKRNDKREPRFKIPEKGIRGTHNRLQLPALEEGFDELFYVKLDNKKGFTIEKWQNEI